MPRAAKSNAIITMTQTTKNTPNASSGHHSGQLKRRADLRRRGRHAMLKDEDMDRAGGGLGRLAHYRILRHRPAINAGVDFVVE